MATSRLRLLASTFGLALLALASAAGGAPQTEPIRLFERAGVRLGLLERGVARLLQDPPVVGVPRGGVSAPRAIRAPLLQGTAIFEIVPTGVMPPGLARRYPRIRSYRGSRRDDPTSTIHLSTGPRGIYARIYTADGTLALEPRPSDARLHRIARLRALPSAALQAPDDARALAHEMRATPQLGKVSGNFDTVRVYRLAMASNAEFTAMNGGTRESGLAAVVAIATQVSAIFERDAGIRLTLVEGSDRLIYTDHYGDPYTNNKNSGLSAENQRNIDQVIGPDNYDVGHILGYGSGSFQDGLACAPGEKAKAQSVWTEVGLDTFPFRIVAHELGHQFNAPHTFNSGGSCQIHRWPVGAYEPGAGVTIMSYGGLSPCPPSDNYASKLPYLHSGTTWRMRRFAEYGFPQCGVPIDTGNRAPAIEAGPSYSIPAWTPFALIGSAEDADGDVLQYTWEQYDLGEPSPPLTDDGTRPIFRWFPPSTTLTRVFPRLDDVRRGQLTPGEAWPTTDRTLTFRFTARDGRGGYAYDTTTLQVYADRGPFRVRSPRKTSTWKTGKRANVVWDVAGTRDRPIRCRRVDIRLSTDRGRTFPTTLASRTPNDGRHRLVAPEIRTGKARVQVACSDNVFFALSEGDFRISR